MKPVRLEKWSVVLGSNDPYLAPELQTAHLNGKAFGHPRFDDGTEVTTTKIVEFKDGLIVTKNTKYSLGEVDPEYESIYPNAKKRLLDSLKTQ